jgi:hypothetical protein
MELGENIEVNTLPFIICEKTIQEAIKIYLDVRKFETKQGEFFLFPKKMMKETSIKDFDKVTLWRVSHNHLNLS